MRISIWQQFSSNHSGGFNLIAQFKSVEDTDKARAVIQHFIETIAAWYKAHPELDEDLRKFGQLSLTPIEEKLAEQYKLNDWEFSVDWAQVEVDEKLANRGFYVFRNLLFLCPPIETWVDVQPFDKLLERHDAHFVWHYYGDSPDHKAEPVVSLVCQAPDETAAAHLVTLLDYRETYPSGNTYPCIRISENHLPYEGQVSHAGAKIEFSHIVTQTLGGSKYDWKNVHASEFLQDLIAYLETQGCTDFELSISEKPEEI